MTTPVEPQPPTSPTPPKKSSNMPIWLIIAGAALLIIILGCCGGFVTCSYFAHRNAVRAQSSKLPASFPADIPVYDGLSLTHAIADSTGANGIVTLSTADGPDAVAAFYRSNMPQKGWTTENDKTFESQAVLAFSMGDRHAAVTIVGENAHPTTVTIAYSSH